MRRMPQQVFKRGVCNSFVVTSMPNKTADTSVPIHPLLAERWSPRGFDAEHELDDTEVAALLESARWTASWGNSQPWRFILGHRGDSTFQRIVENLKPNNQPWAQHASVLLVVCAKIKNDDGEPQRWAEYDAGQAVATMTVQARHMGLHVHQMAGFEPDGIESAFTLPEWTVPVTVVAVGRFDSEADLPEKLAERERATRERLAVQDLLIVDPAPIG